MSALQQHTDIGKTTPWLSAVAGSATLADIDITADLVRRPDRAPDYEREHHAMSRLTAQMERDPTHLLQHFAEVVVDLCQAHTAGISLIEGDTFRWVAVAGACAEVRGGSMPRDHTPSGLCVDRNDTVLLSLAHRYYQTLAAQPPFVEALLMPLYDRATAIGAIWMVSHDDERRFDREDERLIGVLSRFAAAGWQLRKTSEGAVTRYRRQAEFVATLAHELRNPLAALLGAATLLQHVTRDPVVSRATDVIVRQTHHVSRLIADLLDVERIDRGKLQLSRQVVDLRGEVAEIINTQRMQIEGRGQVLTVRLGPGPLLVNADPVRLKQILSNLVDNASQYTPVGGHIAVEVARHGRQGVISVRDSGVGLAADSLVGIFEPFAQIGVQADRPTGGLGLGLAVVRRLTELHGGTVAATSRGRGCGSCFTVRLPVWCRPGRTGTVGTRDLPGRTADLVPCSSGAARESLGANGQG